MVQKARVFNTDEITNWTGGGMEYNVVNHYFLRNSLHNCYARGYRPIKERAYVVLENDNTNTLREIRTIKAYYGANNVGNAENNIIIYADIAGVGKRYLLGADTYYNSKEDYVNGKHCTIYDGHMQIMTDLYGTIGVCYHKNNEGTYFGVCRYAWYNNGVIVTDANLVVTYDVATKKFGYICKQEAEGTYPYKSKDECIADNQIAVCEFEDTAKAKKKVVCIERTETRCYETNMSISAIIDEVRNSGIKGNYRVFVDGDCMIDNF